MARGLNTIEQLREAARRRIPRSAFDYLDGGAGAENGMRRNRTAFDDIRLLPRALTGCEERRTKVRLFDREYSVPFGVAPVGLAGLLWPGSERGLARLAAEANILYVTSTSAAAPLEDIARLAPNNAWFQLYVGRDEPIVEGLVERADAAGFEALCITVDVPAPGKRLRDLANGFTMPLKLTPGLILDILSHPAWAIATARAGPPRFANTEPYAPKGISARSLAMIQAAQSSARLDWAMLKDFRRRWPRRLVVKGLMNPEDARAARDMGADGIVVSNHGGRQLDSAPATIEVLPAVRQAVGPDFTVLLDSGVRTGDDVARAIALGADFVLCGRAFMYGLAALGPDRGPRATLRILGEELDKVLAQLGCRDVAELSPAHVWRPGGN